ncbi:MAG: hypothetical protein FJ303_01300 [Planctomycetes bacterium]|nr:hypothetical protein [Planctomycetota bacterium]
MQFQADGIRFQYPTSWRLTREEAESGWNVTVQSPSTAFFLLTLDTDMPQVEQVAETVLEALRSEYPGLEAETALESIAGQPALGHDIRFFSLDLTNTCRTRVLYSEAGTILLMCQANDLDLDDVEPVFRAICASVRVDEAE